MILKKIFKIQPPLELDINFKTLLSSFFLRSRNSCEKIEHEIEAMFGADSLCLFSVRTGFDLYLKSLNLKEGARVLISEITIKDIVDIIRMNNLTPVPLKINVPEMTHDKVALEKELKEGASVVVFTHLFGIVHDIEEEIKLVHKYGAVAVEDCAQAYMGSDYYGQTSSDLTMFSFGAIKNKTALGGALLRVKDQKVRSKIQKRTLDYPRKKESYFYKRILKFFLIKLLSSPPLWGIECMIFELMGKRIDKFFYGLTRGFKKGGALQEKLKYRLSKKQLLLLQKRVKEEYPLPSPNLAKIESVLELCKIEYARLGEGALKNSYWLLPMICSKSPELKNLMSKGVYCSNYSTSMIKHGEKDLDMAEAICGITYFSKN